MDQKHPPDAATPFAGYNDTLSVTPDGELYSGYDDYLNLPDPRYHGPDDLTPAKCVAVGEAMQERWRRFTEYWRAVHAAEERGRQRLETLIDNLTSTHDYTDAEIREELATEGFDLDAALSRFNARLDVLMAERAERRAARAAHPNDQEIPHD